jgi:hypothetical protein
MKLNVVLQKVSNFDWGFGYNNPIEKVEFTDNWLLYKPTDESQRFSNFDPWDCTTRAPQNVLEFLFNYKVRNNLFSDKAMRFLNGENCLKVCYFDENGSINFLDKFNSILSGTRAYIGNTFNAPADNIRNFGLIPENVLKIMDDGGLPDSYYDEKTINAFLKLGEEFLEIFKLNYEVVYVKDFKKAIKYSPIEVGVQAWTFNGTYYVRDGKINHASCLPHIPSYYEDYDSYPPFIKKLSPTYEFMDYGYVWFVAEKQKNMILKDKHRYTAIIKEKPGIPGHKEYGFAKGGKLIVGDRDEILNLFIDETGGDIKGKVITVLETDFYSVPHYNVKLEKIKE